MSEIALQVHTVDEDPGTSWTKDARPAIEAPPNPGGRWDRAKCSEMCVMAVPRGSGWGHRMFYEACDGTPVDERGVWRIMGATAEA